MTCRRQSSWHPVGPAAPPKRFGSSHKKTEPLIGLGFVFLARSELGQLNALPVNLQSAVYRLPCATDCSVSIAPLNCSASREGLDLAGRKVRANWLSFLPVRRFKARRIWSISHNPRTARPQLDAADRPVNSNPPIGSHSGKSGTAGRLDLLFCRNDVD
jgi:hypothetical protein